MCIQNLKTLAQIGIKKTVTNSFVGEKEKWTDKQYVADSFLHSTIYLTNLCTKFHNLRLSNCWQILTEKVNKQTDKQTTILQKRQKTIYLPLRVQLVDNFFDFFELNFFAYLLLHVN